VLLDLDMPVLNGIQAAERISSQHPYIKIVLLTALDDLASLGKTAGASECLNKSCTPEELTAAIRRAYNSRSTRSAGTPNTDRQVAIERIAVRAGLSENEKTVLERVIDTDLTISQIASLLSTEQSKDVTDSSVKHTLERVMTKLRLEPRTRSALIKHVLDFDDRIMDDPDE
jgi:DNA-binding NarL/FixJ family response regulator